MKTSSLEVALKYDDSLLRELTVMGPDGASWTVASCPAGLFAHLCRETARTLPDVDYALWFLRGYDFSYVADRCHVIRWFLAGEGATLEWIPRLCDA